MINVTKTHTPNQKKYIKYVDKIFKSAWLTNNGTYLKELEQRLKEYLGVKNIILVSNGSMALHVAYNALKLKKEVITTPFSFVATTSTLVWDKLTPIFCDIDKKSLTLDPKKLKKLINKNTSAIVATHVYGNSCDITKIDKICKEHNLKLIYDASHCFGVKYKHQSILNYGDISTISFHATKLFHTIEGGAIITNDDKIANKIRHSINFGLDGQEIEVVGTNAKMNEFQAAMGLCMLDEMEYINSSREKIWNFYKQNLSKNILFPKWNKNCSLNFAYFPIILSSEAITLKVINSLSKHDIYPRRYFYPSLNKLKYIKTEQECLISEDISSRVLCLPIYPDLSLEDVRKIIKIINSIV